MRKIYCFYLFTRVILIALFSFIINLSASAHWNPGLLDGSVFAEANYNGVRDEGETGKAEIPVRIYNASGSIVAKAVTNGEGHYNVSGSDDKTDYLFDFELDAPLKLSASGEDNGIDIQLVSTSECDVDMGILNAETVCSDNSELILSCFVNALGGSNPGQETLVGIMQNFNAAATDYVTYSGVDIDSKYDLLSDDGSHDEYDHDPTGFFAAEILTPISSCQCTNLVTEPYNGLFSQELVIHSVSGEDWFIDAVNQIYDDSSMPGSLVAFTTGGAGYQLGESDQGDGTSFYTFSGVFEDGKNYTIRFTNGDGAFLQYSGGGEPCSYERPVISSKNGLSAVCTGSLHTYYASNIGQCTDYQWTLSGGGTPMGSTTDDHITILWDSTVGGPYELRFETTCNDDCMAPVVEEIRVGTGGVSMSCLEQVNVSLNFDCSSYVSPEVFIQSDIPYGVEYRLMLIDQHGNVVPNNYLTEDYLWQELTAKVIDPCTGNLCWSNLTVEDKMAPYIQCGPISIPCYLLNNYEPIVIDNCAEATYQMTSEEIVFRNCDSDIIKDVYRTYVATDSYGNVSEPCTQQISLERLKFDDIVFPEDLLQSDDTNLTCIDSIYDDEGNIRLDLTGIPTVNGIPVYPIQDLYCNVAIEFEDVMLSGQGCLRKIMRRWTYYEDRCSYSEPQVYVQTIEVFDNEEPVAICPEDVTINSSGGVECEGEWDLVLPEVTDNCASEFLFKISYQGFFDDNAEEGMTLTFPTGTSKLNYIVYDGCDNFSLCDVNITVLDETPPTAVCDINTVVSLRSNGTAKAFASTFDDGSTDDCSSLKMLVKRENSNCECNIPVFEDMFYMGAYSGKFYYMSKFKTHGAKAFLYSQAYGGELVKLETKAEADWVYEQSKSFISNPYYIGLTDADHQGIFTWTDHTAPGFDNWYAGHPIDIGDHVITNADGEWLVVDGNDLETYYVMEVDDQCGYSDEVNFCCADVVEEQTVVLRVIDYFGRYNECTLTVEIQDKVEPDITCPPAREVDCDQILDFADLSQFGDAEASDQCNVTLTEEVLDQRDNCGFGTVIRRFRASDDNGYSECDQILTFSPTNQFDPSTIIWPSDYESDSGCDTGGLHPDIIGRPIYQQTGCSMVVDTFYDATFDFSENDETDACLKILRTWEVIDWCQTDDPDYEPAIYQQTIKVTDLEAPEILGTCEPIVIETFNCDTTTVNFSELAMDSCTDDLDTRLQIDIYGDGLGVFDMDITGSGNTISYNNTLPIGEHFALLSFTDECNNRTTCTKEIIIRTIQGPTAMCIEGLNVALEPMDLDDDGIVDTEMACITPEMINGDTLGSFHPCGFDFSLSFSADLTDTIMCFDCDNLETMNEVELWVTDEFGNTSVCSVFVDVQDNNNFDFCPRFDLALTKTLASNGPFMQDSVVVFDLTVHNQGNMTAYNIELVDYVPFGLTLIDNDWAMMMGNEMATLITPIDSIVPGGSDVIQIEFEVSSNFMGFELTNCAEISAAEDIDGPAIDADSDMDNFNNDQIGQDNALNNENGDEDDHDCETIEVEQIFDISLTKESTGPFELGEEVTFVLTVTNNGTLDAYDVMIVDYIPEGLSLSDTTWTDNGGITATMNSPIAVVPAGGTAEVNIVFTVDADFMGVTITNTAEIIDPNNTFPQENVSGTPGNNDPTEADWDSNDIAIEQTFDLALQKILASDNTPDLGEDVTFEITVYNQGSLDATNIDVMDYIPDGFTFIPAKNTDFVDAAPNAQATIPFLASCDSASLVIVLTLDDQALPAPTLINNAEIIDAENALGQDDQDSPLSDHTAVGVDGTPNELASDNDISDEGCGGTGTGTDNPNDEDDFDGATVDVNCPPEAICIQGFQLVLDENGLATLDAQDLDQGSNDDCSQTLEFAVDKEFYTCDDLGDNVVTLTVTANPSGLTDECMTTITVVDNPEPVALCQDITVSLDSNGEYSLAASEVDAGSSAGCTNNITLDVDPDFFDCSSIGDTVVVLTVTASGGGSDTCEATVTVVDNENPTISCEPDFTVSLSGEMAMITAMDIIMSSDDNCSILSSSIDMSVFDCDDDGMTFTVTATVTDPSGNTNTCTTNVTVDDDEAPSCTLLPDLTFAPNMMITLADIVTDVDTYFSDNCADAAASVTGVPTSFDCTVLGVNTITVTVTDNSGNSATCTTDVTIEDIPAPVCVAQDITVSLNNEGNYDLDASEVDGGSFVGCAVPLVLSVSPMLLECNDVSLSPIDVVLTVTDNNGVSTTCVAEVTVLDDIDPVISCETAVTFDLDANGEVNLDVSDIVLSADDGCGIDTQVLDITMFDCSHKNTNNVVIATVTDTNGNATTCEADITIEDNTAPTCTLLAGLTFPPEVVITPADVLDTFDDNCATASSMSSLSPNEFSCNELGDQVVTLTVEDDCGNSSTCEATVEIVDSSVPMAVCMDITVSLDSDGNYTLTGEELDGGSSAACGEDLEFSVDPSSFTCDSIGANIVVLTVTASGGGSDTCEATVTIQDTLAPVIVCPPQVFFPCETDINDLTVFGSPSATDNCTDPVMIVESDSIDVNTCNVGTIIRTFTATDDFGNTATCSQIVIIEGPNNPLVEADITWPTSPFDPGNCIPDPDSIDSGMPIVDTAGLDCFNITITSSDNVLGNPQCNGTIERTWVVTDSCQAPGGVFTFVQIINILDDEGPDISGPNDITIILPPGNTTCDTFINLAATVTDCTTGFTVMNDSPYADDNNIADASGTYPVGETDITITATDICGNTSTYAYTVSVVDTTAFLMDCQKVIDNIESNQQVVVHIDQTQFELDSGDCMGGAYTVSWSNTVPNQDTIIATCSDVGTADYTIYLWSGGIIIDSCTNLIQIVDGGGFCNSAITDGTIRGTLTMEDRRLIDGVNVDLDGSPFESLITNGDGNYAFPSMAFGGSYRVVPEKDYDYLNGVSTLDLIAIQKHILGTARIESPYKLIAADINRSGSITGSDLLELRKLILGVYDELPNNTSWRFIDKSYKFIDPLNPFAYDIPEIYDILTFDQSMIIDFIGVKVGDINNTAIANASEGRIDRRSSYKFNYDLVENAYEADQIIEILFSSDQLDQVIGIQHSLVVNPDLAEIIEVIPVAESVDVSNIRIADKPKGIINFSWNGDYDVETDEALFSIKLKLKKNAYTSDLLSIDDSGLRSEAYFSESDAVHIGLEYRAGETMDEEISLYQNVPNPWTESTKIKFYMPQVQAYSIHLYDVNGKLIYRLSNTSKKGVNEVVIDNDQFETGGILYYELISADVRLINKMLLLR